MTEAGVAIIHSETDSDGRWQVSLSGTVGPVRLRGIMTQNGYRLVPVEQRIVQVEGPAIQPDRPGKIRRLLAKLTPWRRPRSKTPSSVPIMAVQYVQPSEQVHLACDVCGHYILGWELAPMLEPKPPYKWTCSDCGVLNVAIDAGARLSEEPVKLGMMPERGE